jgi:hypothetical protein
MLTWGYIIGTTQPVPRINGISPIDLIASLLHPVMLAGVPKIRLFTRLNPPHTIPRKIFAPWNKLG